MGSAWRRRAGKIAFRPSGDHGWEKRRQERKRGNSSGQKGSIGGQSPRVWGSIWKATLCLALYCTPCCFNQWQACSQSLEQKWLFFIVLLLAQRFLLHYTPALLTKSLKSGTALSALSESRGNVFTRSLGKGPICSWWFDTLLAPAPYFFFLISQHGTIRVLKPAVWSYSLKQNSLHHLKSIWVPNRERIRPQKADYTETGDENFMKQVLPPWCYTLCNLSPGSYCPHFPQTQECWRVSCHFFSDSFYNLNSCFFFVKGHCKMRHL